MCTHFCKGFGNHLVLTGEGGGLTVPELEFKFLFLFSLLFFVHSYLFLNGHFKIFEDINAGKHTPYTTNLYLLET